jgi:predicted dinucleotide-utilizing enzyme
MDIDTILLIVSGALGVLSALFGVKYAQVKKALKEGKDVVIVLVDAIEDDKISKTESEAIVKEAKEFWVALGAIFKKG